jgi:hypothetical protein
VIRISVSHLDSWLYWLGQEDATVEDMVATLRGQKPQTPAMLAGVAFHSVMESVPAHACAMERASCDGWDFEFALDGEIAVPAIREFKTETLWPSPSGYVNLVGKVDALSGLEVRDYKLTERFDAERYADSYQWRAYLTMFRATQFVYDVFVASFDDRKVTVREYQSLRFHAYPEMEADVKRVVSDLAAFVVRYVPERVHA